MSPSKLFTELLVCLSCVDVCAGRAWHCLGHVWLRTLLCVVYRPRVTLGIRYDNASRILGGSHAVQI